MRHGTSRNPALFTVYRVMIVVSGRARTNARGVRARVRLRSRVARQQGPASDARKIARPLLRAAAQDDVARVDVRAEDVHARRDAGPTELLQNDHEIHHAAAGAAI